MAKGGVDEVLDAELVVLVVEDVEVFVERVVWVLADVVEVVVDWVVVCVLAGVVAVVVD